MKMEQIEQVWEIAKVKSLNKASKNLYISQPNLSVSIKKLEEEIGASLFERSQNGMTLTEEGYQFIALTVPILKSFKQASSLISSIPKKSKNFLRVCSNFMRIAEDLFIETIQEYGADNLIAQYREVSLQKTIHDLESQVSDIGLVCVSKSQRSFFDLYRKKNIEFEILINAKATILVRKDHPLSKLGKSFLTSKDIQDYPLVSYGSLSNFKGADLCKLEMNCDNQAIMLNTRSAYRKILETTDCISIVPDIRKYIDVTSYKNLMCIPFSQDDLSFEIGMIWPKNSTFNDAHKIFIDKVHSLKK